MGLEGLFRHYVKIFFAEEQHKFEVGQFSYFFQVQISPHIVFQVSYRVKPLLQKMYLEHQVPGGGNCVSPRLNRLLHCSPARRIVAVDAIIFGGIFSL